jgi:hypothetical protein
VANGSKEPEEAADPAKDSPKKPEGDGVSVSPQVRSLNQLGADDLRKRQRALRLEREKSDLVLAKWVGWGTLGLMTAQVVVVDAGFFWYAGENNWQVPAGVMVAWLGVGIVQVIGSVVLVVARHLFPGREKDDDLSDDPPKPS